jgi:hypothetical protein
VPSAKTKVCSKLSSPSCRTRLSARSFEHTYSNDNTSTSIKDTLQQAVGTARIWGRNNNCKVSVRLGGEIRLGGGRAKSSPASIWLVRQYVRAWAAKCGLLDILQRANNHGCSWNEASNGFAGRQPQNGHLDVWIWARQHGCAWDEYTCRAAANHGH